jgi:hypothetical protein
MSVDLAKLNGAVEHYFVDFKMELLKRLRECQGNTDVVQFVSEFSFPGLTTDDYTKRKRIKNIIPFHEKCIAKRANGEQCSRRKKKNGDFCGTHTKACPHGVITPPEEATNSGQGSKNDKNMVKKQIEVWLEDIGGIMYWINDSGVVYHPDDIKKNIENPRIIAHYEKSGTEGSEVYKISGEIQQ